MAYRSRVSHRFVIHFSVADPDRTRALQEELGLGGTPLVEDLDKQVIASIMALAARAPGAVIVAANNPAIGLLAGDGAFVRAVSAGDIVMAVTEASGAHPAYLDEAAWRAEIDDNRRAVAGLGWHAAGYVPTAFCFPERLRNAFNNTGLLWMAGCNPEASLPIDAPLAELLHDLVADVITGGASVAEAARNYADILSGYDAELVHGALMQAGDWAAPAVLAAVFDLLPLAAPPATIPPGKAVASMYRPSRRAWVRPDGLYPPPGASVEAPDAYLPEALYSRHPFLVWDGGRLLYSLASDIVACLGDGDADADARRELRMLAEAAFWGPRARERERMRAALVSAALADTVRARLTAGKMPARGCLVGESPAVGMRASLSFEFDHLAGVVEDHVRQNPAVTEEGAPMTRLKAAREHRLRAAESLMRLEGALAALDRAPGAWFRVVDMLDVYSRELYTALDILYRLRMSVLSTRVFERDYRLYVGGLYPPQLPALIDRFLLRYTPSRMVDEREAGMSERAP